MITEAKLDTILSNPKVTDVSDVWAFQDLLVAVGIPKQDAKCTHIQIVAIIYYISM